MILTCMLFFVVINNSFVTPTRIRIEKNGYEDILIALPSKITPAKRTALVSSFRNLLQHSSDVLLKATKGRATFHSVSFLVPSEWGDIDGWYPNRDKSIALEEPKAALSREEADIIITDPDEEVHPYTLHHGGCGRQSRRIYVPTNFSSSGSTRDRSVEFVRLWSEYRYGNFPESGFENDDRFPPTYRIPKEEAIQETGCVNTPFRVPNECELPWNCDGNQIIPSIMDQHYTNGSYFCEGHTSMGQIHNPEAPTKHNVLCSEEGTYFTLLRNSDFKNGKNAALRKQTRREMVFRYIKEATGAKVIVAIDISAQMGVQDRFTALKNAFSKFVYNDLPSGSSLSVFLFGGDENMTLVTSERAIDDLESRITYLESQPLPEEPSKSESSCPECALIDIFEHSKNDSDHAPHVVLITTKLLVDAMAYQHLVTDLKQYETRLHVFMFSNTLSTDTGKYTNWYSLCRDTGNSFVFLGHDDLLGDLYSSFSNIVQSPTSDFQITQGYLNALDEEVLHFPISVDDSLTKSLVVTITGLSFDSDPLRYDATLLRGPDNMRIHPRKQELLPAWIFNVSHPKPGEYSVQTWRKRRATDAVLITATGKSLDGDDPIVAKVWTEIVETKTKFSQPAILIFGEIRKGPHPVINATVKARVRHPNDDGISEFDLIDDGLGGADITKFDGIYSRHFTNFTSIGFYTVRMELTENIETAAAIRKGPSSHCCGSFFPSTQDRVITPFARVAGPATFAATSVPKYDPYPPSKVTDLNITRSFDDKLYVLQWSAVGGDYDQGIAATYEIKIFRDRSLVRHRFFDSGLEVYNETIVTTERASYGTQLYHTLALTQPYDDGLYYIGIRAVDEAGNYGEPSNVVSVWLRSGTSSKRIDCGPVALPFNSAWSHHYSLILIFICYTLINVVLLSQL